MQPTDGRQKRMFKLHENENFYNFARNAVVIYVIHTSNIWQLARVDSAIGRANAFRVVRKSAGLSTRGSSCQNFRTPVQKDPLGRRPKILTQGLTHVVVLCSCLGLWIVVLCLVIASRPSDSILRLPFPEVALYLVG